MVSQLRLARQSRGLVLLRQRRLLATAPPPPPGGPATTPLAANTTIPPPIPLDPPLRGTPPPPRPPRRRFRRFLILTALGVLTFYPVSGYLSTQSEGYRDFFVTQVPGGEAVADYADDNDWESFGFGTVSQKAVEGWQKITGEDKKPNSTQEKVAQRARQVEKDVQAGLRKAEDKTKQAVGETKQSAESAASKVGSRFDQAKDRVESAVNDIEKGLKRESDKAGHSAERHLDDAEAKAKGLADRAVAATHHAADRAKALVGSAKDKIEEATSDTPFNFSDGVEGIVREAERALSRGEAKVESAGKRVVDAVEATPGPKGFLDAQRPRELRPETVKPKTPSYEGKELYSGPPLPLGFEPPPGYYIAPPPKPKSNEETTTPTLPLLVPKVKEFGSSEPIISQLASTIDSLTQSLSTPTSPGSVTTGDTSGILTKAHDDLSALSVRLADVKKSEKKRLEKTLADKAAEFQELLRSKEEERTKGEQGLKAGWDTERKKMVDEWRNALETELESQRQGIEQRLREEVVSQGIELQRRWLRSIKTQVETERGGRLAKLDHLTTSLKQLERITLDNSATLDDNVRLHKVWSALRAVQAKTERGDLAFDDELRVLRTLSTPSDASTAPADPLVLTTLNALEKSGIAQTGVKSYASLCNWFTQSVAPRCQSAALVPAPENANVLSHLASATISKIMFSPSPGLVPGQDVGAVLARAAWCLSEKDLDGATREVNSLKGWPGKLASDWLREARRRLEVMQALEVVGTEATLGSLLLV